MENGGSDLNDITNIKKENVQKKRNKPNIISRLFLCWICPVLVKGNRRDVEERDLIVPAKKFDSDRTGDRLERYVRSHVHKKSFNCSCKHVCNTR